MQSNLDVRKTTTLNDTIINKTLSVNGQSTFSNIRVINEVTCYDKIRFARSNCDWSIYTQSNSYSNTDLILQSTNNTKVSFTDDFDPGTFNFTGSHRCSCDPNIIENKKKRDELIGKIVVSTGTYNNLNNNGIIEIDEAVPVVELAKNKKDIRVFGVIAGFEEINTNNRFFKLGNIRFNRKKSIEDTKIIVNAVGEGGIWICDANGTFNNGELITTGEINGYGVKQDNEFVTSYTVAKITCDCSFDLSSKIYKCEVFQFEGKEYKRAFVGCIYKC
jgi:hypothetical protein